MLRLDEEKVFHHLYTVCSPFSSLSRLCKYIISAVIQQMQTTHICTAPVDLLKYTANQIRVRLSESLAESMSSMKGFHMLMKESFLLPRATLQVC